MMIIHIHGATWPLVNDVSKVDGDTTNTAVISISKTIENILTNTPNTLPIY